MSLEATLAAFAADGDLSGAALAQRLGVTRAAVWKHVEQLRALGVEIDAVAGRGYRLATPIELLDAGTLSREVARQAPGLARSLEVALTIDSTSSALLRALAERGGEALHGCVLLAEHQAAGRGRRGRAWQSPLAASLYASIAWRFERGAAALAGLSLAAGVAVVEALHAHGIVDAALKWPNDVVARGRKLGGLLIELGGEIGGPSDAVLGLGLNGALPARAGAAIDQPWIDLATLAPGFSRGAIAASVIAAVLRASAQFDAEGFAPFRAAYARHDALRGRAVVVHAGKASIEGVARGIDDDGLLLVRVGDATRRYASGEVSVRPAT